MLRKLIRHEFRATARVMLPLVLILLVTSVGANLSTRGLLETPYVVLDLLGGLLVTAFGIAIVGVCIMSIVLMVQRFYKNLLQDEGYVMMTLPVNVHQQVWAKLIVSAVWFALTFLVVMAAGCIMAFDITFVGDLFEGIREILGELASDFNLNWPVIALEMLLLCFLACCAGCLNFYAALAAGHSFPNHKMALSVALFFGFQFVYNFLLGLLFNLLDAVGFDHWLTQLADIRIGGMAAIHAGLWLSMACVVAYGAVYYFVTIFFLKRRLNLE